MKASIKEKQILSAVRQIGCHNDKGPEIKEDYTRGHDPASNSGGHVKKIGNCLVKPPAHVNMSHQHQW